MPLSKSEVTQLLDDWSDGDPEAFARLLPLVFEDLRQVASKHLAGEAPSHTLQATALVNEVYLRLAGRRTVQWQNKEQFFAFMSGMMRRILVDHARKRQSAKRGEGVEPMPLDETIRLPHEGDPDLVALNDALGSLAAVDPRQSRIVELRYFVGLRVEEVAELLGISPTTVKREWRTAKLWLLRELQKS